MKTILRQFNNEDWNAFAGATAAPKSNNQPYIMENLEPHGDGSYGIMIADAMGVQACYIYPEELGIEDEWEIFYRNEEDETRQEWTFFISKAMLFGFKELFGGVPSREELKKFK